ncbi:MAG: DUF4339 domain-containing protein [Planctomycetaceae bacterium]|nr:DUF4339 domain-containing protein [Planctomycetaceae bacterium]
MPSQWYCFTDDEQGPYSFSELARLVSSGELIDSDLVRRAESEDWQRVDEVVGLKRASLQTDESREMRQARQLNGAFSVEQMPEKEKLPFWTRDRIIAAGTGTCILFLGFQIWRLVFNGPKSFPESQRVTIEQHTPQRIEQMRPPAPRVPSLPGISTVVPAPVPGFDDVPWLKSPTLSHDWNSIVYVTYSGEDTTDDLMIATRSKRTEPFSDHHPIETTVTPLRESHPTISPDGRELIFVSGDSPATLMRVSRESPDFEFGPAEAFAIQDDPFRGFHHDAPQFIDEKTLVFTTYDGEYRQRSYALAGRENVNESFQYLDTLPVADPQPRYTFGPRTSRGYFLTDSGLFLTARHPATGQFVAPELMIPAEKLGTRLTEFDGTIWVSPQEDVLFYCSPGRNPENTEDYRLWMIGIAPE